MIATDYRSCYAIFFPPEDINLGLDDLDNTNL